MNSEQSNANRLFKARMYHAFLVIATIGIPLLIFGAFWLDGSRIFFGAAVALLTLLLLALYVGKTRALNRRE